MKRTAKGDFGQAGMAAKVIPAKAGIQRLAIATLFISLALPILLPANAYAMHIEDGILPPRAWIFWYGVAMLFIIPGIREIKRRTRENLSYKPFLAMVGVAIFVISAMHLPVPVTGSCSHPCGTPLAAIVVGPFATAVISAIVLFFQALFLGHGGITTIGANDFSMGVVGGISGYLCWKLFRLFDSPLWLAGGIAGFAGDIMTYLTSAFELALNLHGHISLFRQWMIFFAGYGPTQLPLAVAEAIFTASVLKVMYSRRPDLLPDVAGRKGLPGEIGNAEMEGQNR